MYFTAKSILQWCNCRIKKDIMSLQYQTTYQIMEEDILNYSPTVIFRGTPCTFSAMVLLYGSILIKNK